MLAAALWGVLTFIPMIHVDSGMCMRDHSKQLPQGVDPPAAMVRPCELWRAGGVAIVRLPTMGVWRMGGPFGRIVQVDS